MVLRVLPRSCRGWRGTLVAVVIAGGMFGTAGADATVLLSSRHYSTIAFHLPAGCGGGRAGLRDVGSSAEWSCARRGDAGALGPVRGSRSPSAVTAGWRGNVGDDSDR